MARENDFSLLTVRAALRRQKGRCAICGDRFKKTGHAFNGHHIISNLYGGSNTVDNCVVLCDEDEDGWRGGGCHIFAHGGYFHRQFQLNRDEYIYING